MTVDFVLSRRRYHIRKAVFNCGFHVTSVDVEAAREGGLLCEANQRVRRVIGNCLRDARFCAAMAIAPHDPIMGNAS